MAFEVSSLPTESLHKFMAIGGLAIVIAGFLGFVVTSNELSTDLINVRTQIDIHEIKSASLSRQISKDSAAMDSNWRQDTLSYSDDLQTLRRLERLKKVNKVGELNNKLFFDRFRNELKNSRKLVDEHSEVLVALRQKSVELAVETAEIKGKNSLLELRLKQLIQLKWAGFLAISIGVPVSNYGFRKWYLTQKHVDEALRKAAQL
jgi:hypothetical protein